MNILFYTYWEVSTESGGTERITASIANVLKKDYGHKCYSLYSRPLNPSFPRAPFDARFRLGYIRRPQTIADLSRFIHEKRIDIIVCNSDFAMIPIFKRVTVDMPNTYCVFVYHFQPGWEEMSFCLGSIWHKPFNFIDLLRMIYRCVKYPYMKMTAKERQKAIYRKVYTCSDRIVLLSNNFIPLFSKYGNISDEHKYKVINNMLSFDDFFDMERYDEKRKEVVVVSRFDEQQKRLSLVIRIWSQLEMDSDLADWKLRIIGHGESEHMYRCLASALKLKRLIFEGRQDPQPYYRNASVFMMTSLSEGWGLTLTEAQQMGCVPIAFNTYASLTDIITDGYNGFIIEENALDCYVAQMKRLMLNTGLRKKMAANAVESSKRFEKHFIGKQWNDLFKSMREDEYLTTVNTGKIDL